MTSDVIDEIVEVWASARPGKTSDATIAAEAASFIVNTPEKEVQKIKAGNECRGNL
jgi:hypothetical protein